MKKLITCGLSAVLLSIGGLTVFATSYNSSPSLDKNLQDPIPIVTVENVQEEQAQPIEESAVSAVMVEDETASIVTESTDTDTYSNDNTDSYTDNLTSSYDTVYTVNNNCVNSGVCPNDGIPAQDVTGYQGGNGNG